MRDFTKSLLTWLNAKTADSLPKRFKRALGRLIRRTWPGWPGGAELYIALRVKLGHPIVRADVHGCEFYVDGRDQAMGHYLLTSKEYEPIETDWVAQTVRVGMSVVDVGANIGYYTVLAAQRVGAAGTVTAFEPVPDNFKLIGKNVSANGFQNVRLENKAVLDVSRPVEMFLSDYNFGDHRIFSSPDDSLYDNRCRSRRITVQGVSLDEYFPEKTGVDFVKIDVQGAEVPVLLGMARVLSDNPGVVLMLELWPYGMDAFGAPSSRLFDFMMDCGFLAFELTGSGLTRTDHRIAQRLTGPRDYTNLVFSRKPIE